MSEPKALTPERLRHEPVNRNLNALRCKHCLRVWDFDDRPAWSEYCEKRELFELRAVIKQLVDALHRCWHAENCNTNRLRSTEPDAQVCNCGKDAALAAAQALEM